MKNNKGFTLVELSIVLVIIGLIVGGVVGGQSLIHNAQIQNVMRELQQYRVSINTFQLQYNALPGDMADGSEYWGSDCNSTYCDGNGNGIIERKWNGVQDLHEDTTAWQHLSLAGMLDVDVSGKHQESSWKTEPMTQLAEAITNGANEIWGFSSAHACSSQYIAGVNLPSSKVGEASYWLATASEVDASLPPKPALILGTIGGGGNFDINKLLTPADSKKIDAKLDDGMPGSGVLMAMEDGSSSCVTSSTYNVSVNTAECWLAYTLD